MHRSMFGSVTLGSGDKPTEKGRHGGGAYSFSLGHRRMSAPESSDLALGDGEKGH